MLSYDDMELGYERGYDPPQASSPSSPQKTTQNIETPTVTYWAQQGVTTPPPAARPVITADPDNAAAPAARANKPAQPAAPAAPLPPPPNAAPGATPPPAARNAPRHDLATYEPPQLMGAVNSLESKGGIDPQYYFKATGAPKLHSDRKITPEQEKIYNDISSADKETLRNNYHDGMARNRLTYLRDGGCSIQTAYALGKEEGWLAKDAKVPDKWPPRGQKMEFPEGTLAKDVSVEKVNTMMASTEAMKEGKQLGPPGGADGVVKQMTERQKLINDWKAGQTQWTGTNAQGKVIVFKPPSETQKDAVLEKMGYMKNGVPTHNFDITTARSQLFAKDKPLQPNDKGATKLTEAQDTIARQKVDLDNIHSFMKEDLGIDDPKVRNAILGSRTRDGGPLVDKDGKLLEGVTPEKIQQYRESLGERTDTLREMQVRRADLEEKLNNPEISEKRKDSLNKSVERLDRQIEKSRKVVAGNVREESAEYYRGKMPGKLKEIFGRDKLAGEKAVKIMNGRGYLGENPDLSAMAGDYHQLNELRSDQFPGAKNKLEQELQSGGANYSIATGDGEEARRSQNLLSTFSKEGGAGHRPAAGGAQGKDDQPGFYEQADYNHQLGLESTDHQAEIAEQQRAQGELDKIDGEERAFEREQELINIRGDRELHNQMAMLGPNVISQIVVQAFGALFSGLIQVLQAQMQHAQAQSQANTQASNQMLQGAQQMAFNKLGGGQRRG